MDMNALLSDDLGYYADKSIETLNVSPVHRIDDIFRMCCDTNSQINSLIQLIKTITTTI
jgi:hypothetical protein